MRTPEEIQEAHDFLHAVIEYNDKQPPDNRMPGDLYQRIHAAHDAIGYTLGCPCGNAFEANLKTLRTELEKGGFKCVKYSSHTE